MKVLLCTPYLQTPNVVSGGINIWGNNILNYYRSISSEMGLIIVSFDRSFNVQEDTGVFTRLYQGFKDYRVSINETLSVVDNQEVDVLHLCTSAQLGLIKDLFLLNRVKKKGIKTIIHFHLGRIPELKMLNNWEWKLIRWVCKEADSIIVMDRQSYLVLKGEGFNKTFNVPNPLSFPIIEQIENERQHIKRIPRKILFVGHVIPTKGVYELAEACKNMNKVELHYIGTVSDEDKSKLFEIWGDNTDSIVFRGSIPHEEVIKEMLSCDIFVLPSYTEGFPNVILEAMACGCAIIATKVGAIPEMLEEENGKKYSVLVSPKSSEALYTAIITLLNNSTLKEEIGNNALSRVNERYVMPKVWNQLEAIWKINS